MKRVAVTGATGRIGTRLVKALKDRGDDVCVLSRNAERAGELLGVEAFEWDPKGDGAPAEALAGRDAVVHLAGEDVGKRWSDSVKAEISASREKGTRNLITGIFAATPRPPTLIGASASGYYGAHGDEVVDETAPPGTDWLAEVCVRWEQQTDAAKLGARVVKVRTGIVLDAEGGALAKMLPRSRPASAGRSAAASSTCRGSTSTTSWASTSPRSTTRRSAARSTHPPEPGDEQGVRQGARQGPAPPRDGAGAGVRHQGHVRRDVPDRPDRRPHGPRPRAELGYEFGHPDLDEALSDTLNR